MKIAARDDVAPSLRPSADLRPARNRGSRKGNGRRALACAVLFATLLASCAIAPRLEAPKVAVERVRVDRLTPADARFTVFVAVANPNDREVAVDTIDAALAIEDVPVGTARLAAPVRLPARGAVTAELAARATLASALEAASSLARRAEAAGGVPPTVRYAVSGTATIDGGTTIPFRRTGEVAWMRGAPGSP